VERKSLPDLLGSLNSGRLYTQAEALTRAYRRPLLAIEFDEDRPFALQAGGDVPPDLDVANPVSKLVLLLLHFPALRILWCRTPAATAVYFAALKQTQEEPDVGAATAFAGDGTLRERDGVEGEGGGAGGGGGGGDGGGDSVSALALLTSLPGVTAGNVGALRKRIGCVADLPALTEGELVGALGEERGRLLHRFLHASKAASL
jgi:DNA excision repair protein ERCC-4